MFFSPLYHSVLLELDKKRTAVKTHGGQVTVTEISLFQIRCHGIGGKRLGAFSKEIVLNKKDSMRNTV